MKKMFVTLLAMIIAGKVFGQFPGKDPVPRWFGMVRIDSFLRIDTKDTAGVIPKTGTLVFRKGDNGLYIANGLKFIRVGSDMKTLDSVRLSHDTLYFRDNEGVEIAIKVTGLPQSNIVGLNDTLSGFSRVGHMHSISQVTGLRDSLKNAGRLLINTSTDNSFSALQVGGSIYSYGYTNDNISRAAFGTTRDIFDTTKLNARGFRDDTYYRRGPSSPFALLPGQDYYGYASFDGRPTVQGGYFDHLVTFQSYPTVNITGRIAKVYGSYHKANILAGTVDSLYGAYILGAEQTGATNNLGIFIGNMTKGSNSNYAIYSVNGSNYFGGKLGIGPGVSVPGATLDVGGDVIVRTVFNAKGSVHLPLRMITASRTLDATDYTIRATTSGITITLPSASVEANRVYEIINASAGSINVSTVYVFGVATNAIPANTSWRVQSDGSNWHLLSRSN